MPLSYFKVLTVGFTFQGSGIAGETKTYNFKVNVSEESAAIRYCRLSARACGKRLVFPAQHNAVS